MSFRVGTALGLVTGFLTVSEGLVGPLPSCLRVKTDADLPWLWCELTLRQPRALWSLKVSEPVLVGGSHLVNTQHGHEYGAGTLDEY